MRPYIISTDSMADLSKEYMETHKVQLHPLHYILDGVEYGAELETGEMDMKEFYAAVRNGKKPITNATNVGYDTELFEKAVKEGYDILHLAIASAMSASYNNACVAAGSVKEKHPEANIIVIDTTEGSGGQNLLARRAVSNLENGMSIEENAEDIKKVIPNTQVVFSVPDLMSLYRGGRLKKSAAIIGTVLKVTPILCIDPKGALAVVNKVRGSKAAQQFLRDALDPLKEKGTLPDEIAIEHGDCLEAAEELAELVKEKYGIEKYHYAYLCPTLGAHTGPGVITFSFIEK